MAMIVHSPHDGQPVKVRDQDLERAIRDGEGRIFYAVKRSDGQGYYGALTRKGSDKDEQRYLDMIEKMQKAREVGKQRSAEQVHDATGKASRPGTMRWVILLVLAGLIAAGMWYLVKTGRVPGLRGVLPGGPQSSPSEPADKPEAMIHDAGSAASIRLVSTGHASAPALDLDGYITTASGLHYKILKPGRGDTAEAGRYVLVRYKGMTLDGQVFDRSPAGKPVGFMLFSGDVPRGWDEGVMGMRVGEKRSLVMSPGLMCGRYPGDVVTPDGTLRFEIELVGVLKGVSLTMEQTGSGPIARLGDTVQVQYRAYLGHERQAFDDTYEHGGPVELHLGVGELIRGWELGVVGMRQGERRLIEIPSYLGYGDRGAAGIIPPGAGLRYEVELVGVRGLTTQIAQADRH